MKVTINKTVKVEKELPPYFKYLSSYYMCVGTESIVIVKKHEFQESVTLFPEIRIDSLKYWTAHIDAPIEPISENEFKVAYTKASLEIEKLMN